MPLDIKILEIEKFIGYSFIGELASLRESENKYRQQYVETSHREKILVRRLASKEQELQEYIVCNIFRYIEILVKFVLQNLFLIAYN